MRYTLKNWDGLIRTSKLHGLDPYRYYVQIMEQIPNCKNVEDYKKLLPWQIDMSKVVAELEA